MREHRGETERQIDRLEQILKSLDESHSSFKDATMALGGNLAAMGHMFAADEIIKNSFANCAFESYEAASHKVLIPPAP